MRITEADSLCAPVPLYHCFGCVMSSLLCVVFGIPLVLRYVLEYSPGEIGQILGLPRGTVNSRLRRGLDGIDRHTLEPTGRED